MIELRNFDLNLLLAFKLLVEERSVSRAAEKLCISQPAMSHVLRKLRYQLDDPILVKTSTGMIPTPRAQALLEPVITVLKGAERIIHTSKDFSPANSQRRFLIATSDYVEFVLLPKLVKSVHKQAPNVEIQVRRPATKSPETAIEKDEIDVAIGFDAIFNLPTRICHQRLFTDRIVCITRKNHQFITGSEMSFEQFIASRHMLISFRETGTGLIDDHLKSRGLIRKISLVVPNFLSAPWVVANTDFVLTLPLRIAEHFACLAPIKILPIPIDLPVYDLIMIWHLRQEKEPGHQWLRQAILEVCHKLDN